MFEIVVVLVLALVVGLVCLWGVGQAISGVHEVVEKRSPEAKRKKAELAKLKPEHWEERR